jgi:uncharacterized membrane protein YidH (DUF202 family)
VTDASDRNAACHEPVMIHRQVAVVRAAVLRVGVGDTSCVSPLTRKVALAFIVLIGVPALLAGSWRFAIFGGLEAIR